MGDARVYHLLDNKRKSEALARSHWNNGRLVDPNNPLHTQPDVGEDWPQAYMPYWRKWVTRMPLDAPTHFPVWASVRDTPFWRALAKHLGDEALVGRGLAYAGMHGNTAAFKSVSDATLAHYSASLLGPTSMQTHPIAQRAQGQARLVHPDVVVLMRQKGLWNEHDVVSLASAYQSDDVHGPSLLRIAPMSRGMFGLTVDFLSEWLDKGLQTRGWGLREQTQFLAHMYKVVDHRWVSGHLSMHAMEHLHPDFDIVLFELSMGLSPAWIRGSHPMDERLSQLHGTVASIAQSVAEGGWSAPDNAHPGMMIRMDLCPATTGLELYAMACACKQQDLSPVGPQESIELPAL